MYTNIDCGVERWTEDCYRNTYELRNQCPVCSEYFYDDGIEFNGSVFCSDQCLKEFKGEDNG